MEVKLLANQLIRQLINYLNLLFNLIFALFPEGLFPKEYPEAN